MGQKIKPCGKKLRPCDYKLVEVEKKLAFGTENESLGWKMKMWDRERNQIKERSSGI